MRLAMLLFNTSEDHFTNALYTDDSIDHVCNRLYDIIAIKCLVTMAQARIITQ